MTQPHERAIAHVAALADGGPADPAWRVTLHFHPGRLAGGVPILRRMAAVMERVTFCYPDSYLEPGHFCLDPAMIGDASRAGRHDEQSLKRVWHYLARFGSRETRGPQTVDSSAESGVADSTPSPR